MHVAGPGAMSNACGWARSPVQCMLLSQEPSTVHVAEPGALYSACGWPRSRGVVLLGEHSWRTNFQQFHQWREHGRRCYSSPAGGIMRRKFIAGGGISSPRQ